MLANVLDEYAEFSIIWGDTLSQVGQLTQAKKQYERAISYESDGKQEEAITRLGIAQMLLFECSDALASFDTVSHAENVTNIELYKYKGLTYRDCLNDASRSAEFFSTYEREKKKQETPLERLAP
jgi:tetratricopeptide (TPR) repeat protein